MNKRKTAQPPDIIIIVIYLALVITGWINIYSTQGEGTDIFDFSKKHGTQMLWIIIAVITAAAVMIINGRFYAVFAYFLYGFVALLLLAVLIKGVEVNNSKSWLALGSFRFQPAELAKTATSLVLASFMSRHDFKPNKIKSVSGTAFLICFPASLILLQHDWGSALVFASFLLMFYREGMSGWILSAVAFAAGLFIASMIADPVYIVVSVILISLTVFAVYSSGNLKNTFKAVGIIIVLFASAVLFKRVFDINVDYDKLLFLSAGATAVFALILKIFRKLRFNAYIALFFFGSIFLSYSVDYLYDNVLKPHHRDRIEIILGKKQDLKGAGYNVHQSKIAIGSGGLTGKGYLQGTQTKLNFVPEQSTDFIFCTIGEEWGFLGSVTLILLYVTLLTRISALAERQKDKFARIYGYCVMSIIFFHFAINIAMTIGLFPVIGIPLPFISAGGSSLWSFTVLLFIFLKFDSVRHGE